VATIELVPLSRTMLIPGCCANSNYSPKFRPGRVAVIFCASRETVMTGPVRRGMYWVDGAVGLVEMPERGRWRHGTGRCPDRGRSGAEAVVEGGGADSAQREEFVIAERCLHLRGSCAGRGGRPGPWGLRFLRAGRHLRRSATISLQPILRLILYKAGGIVPAIKAILRRAQPEQRLLAISKDGFSLASSPRNTNYLIRLVSWWPGDCS
jgi:hypothetical protein